MILLLSHANRSQKGSHSSNRLKAAGDTLAGGKEVSQSGLLTRARYSQEQLGS